MSIIVTMIVRNEGHSPYFKRVIDSVYDVVDRFMILDDKSDDGGATRLMCQSYPKVCFRESPFDAAMYPVCEPRLREVQWEETRKLALKDDWILALDADEEMDKSFGLTIKDLIHSSYDWFRFRILDMWTPTEYRVDGMWSPVKEVLFRYQDLPAELPDGVMHIPMLPKYIRESHNGTERRDVKIIHWGWTDEAKRIKKQQFYLDGRAVGFDLEHAKTITNPATLEVLQLEK